MPKRTTVVVATGLIASLLALTGGCAPLEMSITLSADVSDDAQRVLIGWDVADERWPDATSDPITELTLTRCLDEGCDEVEEIWRAYGESYTETAIPELIGPVLYPDDVDTLVTVEMVPSQPPLLVPGDRYELVAFMNGDTLARTIRAGGTLVFDAVITQPDG